MHLQKLMRKSVNFCTFWGIIGIKLVNLKFFLYLCTLKSTLWKARPYYYEGKGPKE